ncbi:hypothetical protein ETAA8_24470 [Anatilimnocola aggregata]|uniref:Uncharacterized protein n=2 Tax=Anatilimnocola aggregata TaxID=2528021 RepID=A0A517YAU6_9BACT|nr:hypothetical protein ETAA8_24470 [Anatilimnocola aggregata]
MCGNYGTALLFESYDPTLCMLDDPYVFVLEDLQDGGLHRNVFLISADGTEKWRVADDPQHDSDSFTDIVISDENPDELIGYRWSGRIVAVKLSDGSMRDIGFTKG